jgi:hypothetical protein
MEKFLKDLLTWSKFFKLQAIKAPGDKVREKLQEVHWVLDDTLNSILAGSVKKGSPQVEQASQKLLHLWRKTSSQDWQNSTLDALGIEGAQVVMTLGLFKAAADRLARQTYKVPLQPITIEILEAMLNPMGICAICRRVAEAEDETCPFCRQPLKFELLADETPGRASQPSAQGKEKGTVTAESIYDSLPPSTIFFLDAQVRQYVCRGCGLTPHAQGHTKDFRCRDMQECLGCGMRDPKPRVLPQPPPPPRTPEPPPLPEKPRIEKTPAAARGGISAVPARSSAGSRPVYHLPSYEEIVSGLGPAAAPARPSPSPQAAPAPSMPSSIPPSMPSSPALSSSSQKAAPPASQLYGALKGIMSVESIADADGDPEMPPIREPGPPVLSPWPFAGGSSGRTGQSLYTGPLMGRVKWTTKMASNLNTPPVVGPQGCIFIGTLESGFVKLTSEGEEEWTFLVDEPIMTAAGVSSRGTVYFGTHNKFFCLNPDGSPRWVFRKGCWHPPVADERENVYVISQADLFCLSPDGRLMWEKHLGESAVLGFDLRPALDSEGNIYVVTEELGVYSPSGQQVSRVKLLGETTAPAVDAAGRAYIGEGGVMKCLRGDGSTLWTNAVEDLISTPPAVSSDGYVAFGVKENPDLYYLNPQGKIKWKYNVGEPLLGSPIIDSQGNVFCLTQGSRIFAVSFDGQQLWQLSGRSFGFLSNTAFNKYPALGERNLMLITTLDGRLLAIE